MKRKLRSIGAFILLTSMLYPLGALGQCHCTYTVPLGGQPDGNELGLQPGDTICLEGGVNYNRITFSNINGTPDKPIIITNCNGQAFINSDRDYGVTFKYSKNFKILGNGDENVPYGIKISTPTSFYLSLDYFSTDFEIAFLEIAGSHPEDLSLSGFAGMGIKTSPYRDCDLFKDKTRTAWIMKNVSIHDNYIHDVGGEGIYLGHGFYKGRIEEGCTDSTYSHSIQNLEVYNNRIENTGYDGLQIKNADKNCKIHNNTIRNFGKLNVSSQNEGIVLGEGVTGECNNNIISNGTGNGIQFHGMGNNKIYNNLIVNCGEYGFYGASGPQVIRIDTGFFKIYNNTFIYPQEGGLVFYNDDGGEKEVLNNLFVGSQGILKGATITEEGNLTFSSLKDVLVVDSLDENFNLQENSPVRNKGIDLSLYNIILLEDVKGNLRAQDGKPDVGAFEYAVLTNNKSSVNDISPLSLFPNPLSPGETLHLIFNSVWEGQARLQLISDVKGILFEENIRVKNGRNEVEITKSNLEKVSSGLYFLKLELPDNTICEKLLLE